jgi:hypothetical protein
MTETRHFTRSDHANSPILSSPNNIVKTADNATPEADPLSQDYHQTLVNQYRELVAPLQGEWEDSSDEEDKGRDLRLVPAPLFWKNRQQELYPRRVEHFLANKEKQDSVSETELKGTKWGMKKKRESTSAATPERTMTGQLKEEYGQPEKIKSAIRGRSFFKSRYRATSKDKLPKDGVSESTLRSPSRQNKVMNDPPLPLQLPKIAFNTSSMKSAPGATNAFSNAFVSSHSSNMKSPPAQARASPFNTIDYTSTQYVSGRNTPSEPPGPTDLHPSVQPDTLKEIERSLEEIVRGSRRSSRSKKKTQSSSTTYSYGSSSSYQTTDLEAVYQHRSSLPRNLDEKYGARRTSEPLTPPPKEKGASGRSMHSAFYKARNSLTPGYNAFSFGQGHRRSVSSPSTNSQDPMVTFESIGVPYTDMEPTDEPKEEQSNIGHMRTSSYQRPKFIDKALDVKKRREMVKRRKELKASIKVVGQMNSNNIEAEKGRKESFGFGWI